MNDDDPPARQMEVLMSDRVACRKCGGFWVFPKELESVLNPIEPAERRRLEELLTVCPKCRPQAFAERTIGKELKKVARDWSLPQRRVEETETGQI